MGARWAGRLASAVLLVATLGAVGTTTASAKPPARSVNTAAVAVNQVDGATQTDFDFDVWRTSADQVTARNVAYGLSTCDGCTTAAVSIQIVLSGRAPSMLQLENQSVALNLECQGCSTTSIALQFVVAVDQKLGLTGAGRSTLADVQRQLRSAVAHDASPTAVSEAANEAAARIVEVLQTDLRVKPVVKKHLDVAHGPS